MKEKEITVVKVEPMKEPVIATLTNDLDHLQKAVSIGADYQGLIEFVYLEDNVSILCNEEGKLIGLPPNRHFYDDILCGVFYVVAEDDKGNLIAAILIPKIKLKRGTRLWKIKILKCLNVTRWRRVTWTLSQKICSQETETSG